MCSPEILSHTGTNFYFRGGELLGNGCDGERDINERCLIRDIRAVNI